MKIRKLAALLGAGALLFALAACGEEYVEQRIQVRDDASEQVEGLNEQTQETQDFVESQLGENP